MSPLLTLKSILVHALGLSVDQDANQELFNELTAQRDQLSRVFDFGPKSQQELKEVESGTFCCTPSMGLI